MTYFVFLFLFRHKDLRMSSPRQPPHSSCPDRGRNILWTVIHIPLCTLFIFQVSWMYLKNFYCDSAWTRNTQKFRHKVSSPRRDVYLMEIINILIKILFLLSLVDALVMIKKICFKTFTGLCNMSSFICHQCPLQDSNFWSKRLVNYL